MKVVFLEYPPLKVSLYIRTLLVTLFLCLLQVSLWTLADCRSTSEVDSEWRETRRGSRFSPLSLGLLCERSVCQPWVHFPLHLLVQYRRISNTLAMYRRILWLAVVALVVEAAIGAQRDAVELKGRMVPSVSSFMNYAKRYLSSLTSSRISVTTTATTTFQEDVAALSSREVDFVITPYPFQDLPAGAQVLHYPIATGGLVILANTPGAGQVSMNAKQVAHLFSGKVTSWDDLSILKPTSALKNVPGPVKIVLWEVNGPAATEIRRFLENNSEGEWKPNDVFTVAADVVGTYQEAVEYVKNNVGSVTFAPFGETAPLQGWQIFVPQSADYVSPTLNAFANSLMPFKKPEDVPNAEETDRWNGLTLTDMRKMPPDGSCMSMPPYAISRFYYLIILRDQQSSASPPLHGAALAALIRVFNLPDIQSTASSTSKVTSTPPAAMLANVKSINSIQFRAGESLETFLADAPLADASLDMPEMPPGINPNSMPGMASQASPAVVAITIVLLLLSGIIAILAYIGFMKYKYGGSIQEHTTWVPWNIKPSTRGQTKQYQPLNSMEMSSTMSKV